MSKAIDPRELLNKVIELINVDIQQIQLLSKDGKLSTNNAGDLVRYSQALLALAKDADQTADHEKRTIDSLSTEELREQAKRYLEGDHAEE